MPGTDDGAPSASTDARRIAAIRADVDEMLTSQAKILFESWTRGRTPDLGPSVAGREPLLSRETVAFVKAAALQQRGDERRARSLLHAFLLGEYLSREASRAVPTISPPMMIWKGQTIPTTRARELLASEPDPARRAAIERAWVSAERRQANGTLDWWQALSAAARRVGYPTLVPLAEELRGESVNDLAALAEATLAGTQTIYSSLLDDLGRSELRRPLTALRGRDLPRLLATVEGPRVFPSAQLSSNAKGTFAKLGLDLAGREGVLLDEEARPGKDPRALTLPVQVPRDVRVAWIPAPGAEPMRALLNEMGAAAFYSRITSTRVEFRRLGTVTVRAWADLFEELTGDPAWLALRSGSPQSHIGRMVQAAAVGRLHDARRLAARLLVEIGRGRGTPVDAKALLARAFARPVEQDELDLFLLERDPLLESADRLRSALIAAQAEVFLGRRAGGPWWNHEASGAWLASAFAEGSRLTPAELSRELGAEKLDASALAATCRARVSEAGVELATVDADQHAR